MTGLILPACGVNLLRKIELSSQEKLVVQNSTMDTNSQTLQVPPWLSFALESEFSTQANIVHVKTVFERLHCIWLISGGLRKSNLTLKCLLSSKIDFSKDNTIRKMI